MRSVFHHFHPPLNWEKTSKKMEISYSTSRSTYLWRSTTMEYLHSCVTIVWRTKKYLPVYSKSHQSMYLYVPTHTIQQGIVWTKHEDIVTYVRNYGSMKPHTLHTPPYMWNYCDPPKIYARMTQNSTTSMCFELPTRKIKQSFGSSTSEWSTRLPRQDHDNCIQQKFEDRLWLPTVA